ncbi:hypothetical protein M378DRAFT_17366 [Amanita muscaria Koide BX008]|uniref:Uncharacterized protein n=1 Tax=Amanita muscaria (strain Koide BX008) TaxID=946122 RepID=A0A0C2W4T2_AMAMK|nr:hypothetical protein M378DRAFT_17366 [Amanita muscaria Koide BX008]
MTNPSTGVTKVADLELQIQALMEEKRKAEEEEQRLREEAERKAKEEEEKKKREEEERRAAEEEKQRELAAAEQKRQQEAERVLYFQRGSAAPSASSSAKKRKLTEEDEADAEETDEEEDSGEDNNVTPQKVVLGEPLEKDCDRAGRRACGRTGNRESPATGVSAKTKRGTKDKGKKKSKFADGSDDGYVGPGPVAGTSKVVTETERNKRRVHNLVNNVGDLVLGLGGYMQAVVGEMASEHRETMQERRNESTALMRELRAGFLLVVRALEDSNRLQAEQNRILGRLRVVELEEEDEKEGEKDAEGEEVDVEGGVPMDEDKAGTGPQGNSGEASP